MAAEHADPWFRDLYARAVAALQRGDPATAEQALRAVQVRYPGEANSLRVLGVALLAQGRTAEAISALELACASAPDFPHVFSDLGAAYLAAARPADAERALRRALGVDARLSIAWRRLGDALVGLGRLPDARMAFDRSIATDPARREFDAAAAALAAHDVRRAEGIFRALLRDDPNDVGALCGLASVSLSAGHPRDAERLLRHALRQTAHMPLVWRGLGQALLDAGRHADAEAAVLHALEIEPDFAPSWVMLGSIRAHRLRGAEALEAFDAALALSPRSVHVLLSKGHVLKTLGRRSECEAAYHACLEMQPDFAEAYCSLADLKTYRFTDAEVAAMQRLATGGNAAEPAAAQLEFALGRALEQRGEYASAFAHYREGNVRRRRGASFDAAAFEHKCRRVARQFDAPFLAAHRNGGCQDPAPIFVVGLPRSGSTLVEQILASHPLVDGTMELPNLPTIVRELDRTGGAQDAYPESVAGLSAANLRELGERYIAETHDLRGTGTRFVDKMPNNFSHVGLLELMLPNATIVDVRRNPLDACLSAFKQYFAQGQLFSCDLEDLGRYYRAYLGLMDHWDKVLPGKVLCVAYESLVRDPEGQVRRLLAHCGLPFDSSCLRFHETERPVRTASSEQVRQPLYDSGVGYWRHFEAELEPLKRSLGDTLDRFRAVLGD